MFLKKLYITIIYIMFMIIGSSSEVLAKESYTIDNLKININITSAREFEVTEIIELSFQESDSNFRRILSKDNPVEAYNIEEIKVNGKNQIITKEDKIIIEFDEGDSLKEKNIYEISYKIKTAKIPQINNNYIYLNILGGGFDCSINKLSIKITYPKNGKVELINITSGNKGSRNNDYIDYYIEGNEIYIESKKTIENNLEIMINSVFDEGLFNECKEKKLAYIIKNDDLEVKITKEKEYLVKRKLIIERNNHDLDKKYKINFWNNENKGIIKDISINGKNLNLNRFYIEIPNKGGEYEFNISYKVKLPMNYPLNMDILNYSKESIVENFNYKIQSDININNYSVESTESNIIFGKKIEGNLVDNREISIVSSGKILGIKENVKVDLNVNNEVFLRKDTKEIKIFFWVNGGLIIILFCLWLFRKSKYINKNILIVPILMALTNIPVYWLNEVFLAVNFQNFSGRSQCYIFLIIVNTLYIILGAKGNVKSQYRILKILLLNLIYILSNFIFMIRIHMILIVIIVIVVNLIMMNLCRIIVENKLSKV